jgi:hypothetical protein
MRNRPTFPRGPERRRESDPPAPAPARAAARRSPRDEDDGPAPRRRYHDEGDSPRRRGGDSAAVGIIAVVVLGVLLLGCLGAGAGVIWLAWSVKPAANVAGAPAPVVPPPAAAGPAAPAPPGNGGGPGAPPAEQPPFAVDPQLAGDWSKVYLTDMTPFDVKNGPWELGRGNLGNPTHDPIVLRGTPSPHGLGTHPPWGGHAAAKYVLGRRANTFRASVGLQDRPPNEPAPSPITFLVFGDGRLLWQSRVVSTRGVSEDCSVDVRGVNVLELRTDAKASSFGSHAVWFEPHVLKDAPPAGSRPDLLPGDRGPPVPPGK